MAEKAHVSAVEDLDTFRAALLVYVSKARPAVEEVSAEVMRTRLWLQNDQRMHWENQVRRRTKELEIAEQALSSARMSSLRHENSLELNAVRKARRALDDAGARLKTLKHWDREFDLRAGPLVKQLEKLQSVLTDDMAKAAVFLAQAVNTLSDYASIAAPSVAPAPVPESTEKTDQEGGAT